MAVQYDPAAHGYRAPRDLIVDISQQYALPRDRADACKLILAEAENELAARVASFNQEAATALDIGLVEIRERALKERQRVWMELEQDAIKRMGEPIWYYSSDGPGSGSLMNHRPPGYNADIKPRRAISAIAFSKMKKDLPERLKEAEKGWDDFQIASAISDLIRRDPRSREKWISLSKAFQGMRKVYEFRNSFRHYSVAIISIGAALPEQSKAPSEKKAMEKPKGKGRASLIPLACDRNRLRDIVSKLYDAELLSQFDLSSFDTNTRFHFYLLGEATEPVGDHVLEKMRWRGTLYELIAFFNVLFESRLMNESEFQFMPSMISEHFLQNGEPISARTIATQKSGETNEGPLADALERMRGILNMKGNGT